MGRKRYTPEQIIGILRQVEVSLGQRIGQVYRDGGITQQTYYRWRRQYEGVELFQARRMKELERENSRLKRAVAKLTLDKLILKEALEGSY